MFFCSILSTQQGHAAIVSFPGQGYYGIVLPRGYYADTWCGGIRCWRLSLELRDGGGPPLHFSRPRLHESGLFTPYVRGDQLSRRGRSNAGGDSRRTATGTLRSCSAAHSARSGRRLRGRGVNKTTGGVVCSQPCGTRGNTDFAHTGLRYGPYKLSRGGGGGGGDVCI